MANTLSQAFFTKNDVQYFAQFVDQQRELQMSNGQTAYNHRIDTILTKDDTSTATKIEMILNGVKFL